MSVEITHAQLQGNSSDFLTIQKWMEECDKIPEKVNAQVLDARGLSKLLQLEEPFGKHHGLGQEVDRLLNVISIQDKQISILKKEIKKLERWINIHKLDTI